jgi:NADH-quinone oxidoreductase subunit N
VRLGWSGLAGMGGLQRARAAGFSLALLSLAGAPPLGGFFGEFAVAAELAHQGHFWLLTLAALGSVLAIAGAIRALRVIYLEPASESDRSLAVARSRAAGRLGPLPGLAAGGGAAVAVAVAAYGIFADPILRLAVQGAAALGPR